MKVRTITLLDVIVRTDTNPGKMVFLTTSPVYHLMHIIEVETVRRTYMLTFHFKIRRYLVNVIRGFFKSRTVWFNIITGAVAVVSALQGKVVPVEAAGYILAIGNIFLRILTNEGLEEKGEK